MVTSEFIVISLSSNLAIPLFVNIVLRYPLQTLNISNQTAGEIEENVWNVVGNVVILKAKLQQILSVYREEEENLAFNVYLYKLAGWNFKENTKVTNYGLLNTYKIDKVEIFCAPHGAEEE